MKIRPVILIAALAAAALPLRAQEFRPTRPIEFVVHTGPGGGADVLARFIANAMEKEKLLPVRMVVVNKTGGGGQTAMAYLVEKRGDAHTIAPFLSLFFTVPIMTAEARVTMKDVTPVARLLFEPALIVVKNDAPYKTLKDFIDAAKQNPGSRKQSSASLGGRDWMVRQLLMKHTGANWAFISFPNMGERIAAVLGGHVDMMFIEPQEAGEHIRGGNLRVIAQISDTRLRPFPNVPTVKEAGYDIPNVPQVRGIIAPPGIARDVLAYWEERFAGFVKTPSWRKYLEDNVLVDAFLRGDALGPLTDRRAKPSVPFGGKFPTLGTNPHSWAFPTQDVIGFPICIDWATSPVAMGRVQQFVREGKQLPPGSGVDEQGKERPIVMGSYGIGSGRLLACVAEEHHDDKGLIWPITVSPYDVHLIALRGGEAEAQQLYERLQQAGFDVLFDDRYESPGVKFNDADLIGIPVRLTISERSLKRGNARWPRTASCSSAGRRSAMASRPSSSSAPAGRSSSASTYASSPPAPT